MRLPVVALSVAALVAGCATSSPITPYGRDSYLLVLDDFLGGSSSRSLQVSAAQQANAHCAGMGKVMRVRNYANQGTVGFTPTSSSLIFSCIAESDPENTRPDLQPAPTTVIEDRRR